MATIFSKIIAGEIPCYKVYEDDSFLSFLDIQPVAKGHLLVIPKREVDFYFDLSEQELAAMNAVAKKIALALKKVVPCAKIGVSVIGLEVPHAHMHLIPIDKLSDMDFSKARLSFSNEEYLAMAAVISAAIE